ncbi:MAG: orotate phosphoribosyltransferase [Bacteroidales bacterium]|nr:orotate phosphoribosyltransferase [Bacteroidales bacterium]
MLLQIKAIKLNYTNPFTWTSGIKSPIYCDNRIILSYPDHRTEIANFLKEIVIKKFSDADYIAGVATAGIPMGTLIAHILNKPFIYVRPKAKEHGLHNQIEGFLPENKKVVVVEDLISTGKSSKNAISAIREANCEVIGLISIFSYAFSKVENDFNNNGIKVFSLADYPNLLPIAIANKYIPYDVLHILEQWHLDPKNWYSNFFE